MQSYMPAHWVTIQINMDEVKTMHFQLILKRIKACLIWPVLTNKRLCLGIPIFVGICSQGLNEIFNVALMKKMVFTLCTVAVARDSHHY